MAAAPRRFRPKGGTTIDLMSRPRGPRRAKPFKPFVAPKQPPPGWYDPTLDANQRAANRGLRDFRQDTDIGQERADTDYTLGRQQINRGASRPLADIMRARTRTGEDVGVAQQAINRRYTDQRAGQMQAGNVAGVLGGGFIRAAARRRADNKQVDDSALQLSARRAGEDSQTAQSRTVEDRDLALANLGLGYTRGNEDRQRSLSRAQRENTFFGQDVGAQRAYEGAQAGYIPPRRPKNEHSQGGLTWRTQRGGYRMAGGRVITGRELARRLRRRGR